MAIVHVGVIGATQIVRHASVKNLKVLIVNLVMQPHATITGSSPKAVFVRVNPITVVE
jgi:hypothetical protein